MAKTVLVVDDDDNTRRFLTVALEENGYEAITAADGDEGYKKIQEMIPDLILLDVMMPKKTGFSLFKQLRRSDEFKEIPLDEQGMMMTPEIIDDIKRKMTIEFPNLLNSLCDLKTIGQ